MMRPEDRGGGAATRVQRWLSCITVTHTPQAQLPGLCARVRTGPAPAAFLPAGHQQLAGSTPAAITAQHMALDRR